MYGSQQNQKIDKNKYEKNIKEILLCNFLLGTLQYFKKRHPFFFATKEKKKHPQKLLKNIHFFHPELPKWPKKKGFKFQIVAYRTTFKRITLKLAQICIL